MKDSPTRRPEEFPKGSGPRNAITSPMAANLMNTKNKVIKEDKHGTYSGTFYGDKENQDNLEEGNNDENLNLPNEQEVETDDLNKIPNILSHKL